MGGEPNQRSHKEGWSHELRSFQRSFLTGGNMLVPWGEEPRTPKVKTYTTKLSKTEIDILQHYRSLGKRFECSVEETAAAVDCGVATVHRTNKHLAALSMLSWVKGDR